ncbi:hypothetical protein DRO61_11935 [Candidatus Bathyarchaeota archaeon]|nr:MAG: hypothetical protein DRO61_11935 [Candidatus Bathyarchaeota archaeon]
MKELIRIANMDSVINAGILHAIHLYLHESYIQRPGRPITPSMFKELLKEDYGSYLEYIDLLKNEGVIKFKISDDKINIWIYPCSFILKFLKYD